MSAKPNIVFILIDDLGWRDLGCSGSTFYETPNLDRLAEQGMLFTKAYASCPVCSPTRASIMSGKYPARVGVTQYIGGQSQGRLKDVPYLHYLPLEEKSLAAALREQGYQTWHLGKWHLGDEAYGPEQHGFDVNVGGCDMGHPRHGYFSPWGIPTLEDGPEGEYLTDRITEEALKLIRKRGDRPFFMHLAHYAVHTPIQAPDALVRKYRRKAVAMGLDQLQSIVPGEHFPADSKRHLHIQRRVIQSDPSYAAMIENLDINIGRVLDLLAEERLDDDTIVIFTSDNGGLSTSEGSPTCNFPLSEGKGWNYEGGTRVCQIVRWPGVVGANTHCTVPVISTDFYPTLLEAVGADPLPDQHCDGVSLMGLLRGDSRMDRDALFWHYPHYGNQGGAPAASVIAGDWKLIEHFEERRRELFNLRDDISEVHDLAAERPDKAEELQTVLTSWYAEVGARIPEPNPEWRPS